jgi:hypothetical protein
VIAIYEIVQCESYQTEFSNKPYNTTEIQKKVSAEYKEKRKLAKSKYDEKVRLNPELKNKKLET